MKSKCLAIVLAATLASGICYAQTNQTEVKDDFKPSALNQPGQEYPQVNSQGYARFRIKAPQADSIKVSLGLGGRGGTRLTKGADGYFTGTTEGPMDEGFHYYHLTIDGGVFNDPGTQNYYGSTRWESGIEIPAHDADFTPLKMFLTAMCSKFCFNLQAPILYAGLLFIHLRAMKRKSQNATRYYTCSMDGVKMKPPGATRATPTLLWTT